MGALGEEGQCERVGGYRAEIALRKSKVAGKQVSEALGRISTDPGFSFRGSSRRKLLVSKTWHVRWSQAIPLIWFCGDYAVTHLAPWFS
jgi:hypothetical protein